jgi:hypothetical protein
MTQISKKEFNFNLDEMIINATETRLNKAGVTSGFDRLLEGFCGRILCGAKSEVKTHKSSFFGSCLRFEYTIFGVISHP